MGLDACQWATGRAAVQMVLVDPQVRRPNRLVRPSAMDTTVRPAPLASDASADPDAVRLAADFPALCQEAVPDFRP